MSRNTLSVNPSVAATLAGSVGLPKDFGEGATLTSIESALP